MEVPDRIPTQGLWHQQLRFKPTEICRYLHSYTMSCILNFDETCFLDG